jgi:hypothetical protein
MELGFLAARFIGLWHTPSIFRLLSFVEKPRLFCWVHYMNLLSVHI